MNPLASLGAFFKRFFVDKQPLVSYASTSMAITFDEDYKNKIGFTIIVELNKAIKSGELPDNELSEVCTYVTVGLKHMKSHDELTDFLKKMTGRWNFFKNVHEEVTKQNSVVDTIENNFLNRLNTASSHT